MTRSIRWLRFIQTLKIRSRDRRIIPLVYNRPQQIVWESIAEKIDRLEPIRLIVLKARREGISTAIESWMMALIASQDNVNALVTAHQKGPATKIFNMAKLFVNASPLLSRLARIESGRISIGSSSLEVATAGTPEQARGGDLTAWHASEAAFYPFPEVLVATMQSLPHSKDIFSIGVIESTANAMEGPGETFYDEWCRAEAGESEWIPVFLAWHQFPEYSIERVRHLEDLDAEEYELRQRFELTDGQLAWRRWAIRNNCQGKVQIFHQEYPSTAEEAFIQSGLPFFQTHELLWLNGHLTDGRRGTVETDGAFRPSPDGWLEVFRFPEEGHTYVVGADSSMGIVDKDDRKQHSRSAGCVIDMDTMEQVAEYDAATAPHIFARHLVGICRLYKNAMMAPEVQASGGGGGREVLVYVRDMGYYNIHQWKGDPDRIRHHDAVLYGWETNSKTRPRMLARIREVVMEKSAIIHSRRLFKQLASFGESDSGHIEALAGRDDLLFAYGIALMSRSENYYKAPTHAELWTPPIDWQSLGIAVKSEVSPNEHLRARLLGDDEPTPKSFMEL